MILNFLNKTKNSASENKSDDLIKIIALMIHAARIDENYTEVEKKIIFDFVTDFSKKSKQEVLNIINISEQNEKNSNQILDYTKSVKKMDLNLKTLVIKTLWKIILSDNKSGQYENNLMRRICGLLYIPDKLSGEIKLKIIEEKKL
tara:strand:- start:1124 stop:1561 length:438 start_codon:yes stop_codon:yes gene_type:complete